MRGKIIGGYYFKSKKSGSDFANIYLECIPNGVDPKSILGCAVEKYMVAADRMPEPLSNMVGCEYQISTQNNFISDFFKIPSGVK